MQATSPAAAPLPLHDVQDEETGEVRICLRRAPDLLPVIEGSLRYLNECVYVIAREAPRQIVIGVVAGVLEVTKGSGDESELRL